MINITHKISALVLSVLPLLIFSCTEKFPDEAILSLNPVKVETQEGTQEEDDEAGTVFTLIGNGKTVTFKMIKVKHGSFQMGSDSGKSVHQVTLTNDYYMGETEVTQALWYAVMGQSPTSDGSKWSSSYGLGDGYPAYYISYEDCQKFLTKLNQLTGQQFRFPTEAEWEYAARGGSRSKGYTYSGSNNLGDVAWYADNSSSTTHVVKTKAPNELGLYDMSGNVYEWCADWYGSSSYQVNRGGSWFNTATCCRVANRDLDAPSVRSGILGIRLAL